MKKDLQIAKKLVNEEIYDKLDEIFCCLSVIRSCSLSSGLLCQMIGKSLNSPINILENIMIKFEEEIKNGNEKRQDNSQATQEA